MEQATAKTGLQNVKNQQAVERTSSLSLTKWSDRQDPSSKLYLATMLRVVRKSISLANAPSLTEGEYGLRASDWCELLNDIVPESRLMDAFMRAAKDHKSDFPVNAYEVKNAWANLEAEEREARKTKPGADNPSAIEACSIRDKHIDDDRAKASEGLIELYDPSDDSTRVVPCYQCRRRAFEQRQAEYIESKKGSGVPRTVTSAIDAVTEQMEMGRSKPVQDDGRELLAWAQKEFLKDYLAAEKSIDGVTISRKFKYQLFGKVWHVRLTEDESQRTGMMIFHAQDYIKLGPEAYGELKRLQDEGK